MIEILSAPFDLGGKKFGSRMGPDAIRLCDLQASLAGLGYEVKDLGHVTPGAPAGESHDLRGLAEILPMVESLRQAVTNILEEGNLPLVLCGEHTLSAGSISAAARKFGSDLFVLWIDAHADINTPDTSASGNLHGMPLAALQQIAGEEVQGWNEWLDFLRRLGPASIDPGHVLWYGLRDVDEQEKPRVRKGHYATMHHIDREGVTSTVLRMDEYLRRQGCKKLWISFDVDVLDPSLAPGTGTAVRGGLTYREAHLMAEILSELLQKPDCPYELAGLDVVEVNPLADTGNQTALLATEWVASLFGKSIL